MLTRMVQGFSLDVKLALRLLAKYPGLTIVGSAALAFGIAAGVVTAEIRKQFVDPTIPLEEGTQLVGLRYWDAARNVPVLPTASEIAAWRDRLSLVEDVSVFTTFSRNLITGNGEAEVETVAAVSPSAFRAVRVPPLLGRTFVDRDAEPGASSVIVIGHDIWTRRFAANRGIVGRTVRLGSETATVIGVMPAGFHFPAAHNVWMPLEESAAATVGREAGLLVFGRLSPRATKAQAQAELRTISAGFRTTSPDRHAHLRAQLIPYAWLMFDPTEIAVGLSLARVFVLMLLVLVSANVALLVFARAATRESEIAVRSALGARRTRIIAQLFVEALALAGVASIGGLVAAQFGLRSFLAMYRADSGRPLPFWVSDSLTLSTVIYAGGLAILATTIVGVIPALKTTGRGLQDRLRQSPAGAGGPRFGGVWTVVIVAQVAVTLMFPATAFFFHRWVVRGQAKDVGFDATQHLSARLTLEQELVAGPADGAPQSFRSRADIIYAELTRRLESESGVRALTFADRLPGTLHSRWRVEIDGEVPTDGSGSRTVSSAAVALNFFDALGAAVLDGRAFTPADIVPEPTVAIVNQSFVTRVLGGRNPLGRRMRRTNVNDEPPGPWLEIIGVVPDLGMGEDVAGFYRPISAVRQADLRMIVSVRGEPLLFAPRLRSVALAVEPALQLHDVMPLDRAGASEWLESQYLSQFMTVLSAIALLMSLTAIYSVTAVTVSRHTREIGLRVALGADRRRVLAVVLHRPLTQVGLGVVFGSALVAAMFTGFYEAAPTTSEALLIAAYAMTMIGVCLLACVVPARRALAIQPARALTVER